MISTRCWMPTGRSSTIASGSTARPNRSEISLTSLRASLRFMMPGPLTGSTPRTTFSQTENTGTSMKCWWTIPIPALMASPGSLKLCTTPSMTISPASGW